MNQNLIPFIYKGTEVRTISRDGEPWFVVKDVCDILDIRTDAARSTLDEDEVSEINPNTIGVAGGRNPLIVSEAGLYNLILRSRKPGAKAFKRWVTHEVLPSIRKRGGYLTPEATEQALLNPDFIIQLATSLKEERAKTQALESKITRDAPKVLFAEAVTTSKSSILIGQLAKILTQNGFKIGQNKLFELLREQGYLVKQRGQKWNQPKDEYVKRGLFEVKTSSVMQPDGAVRITHTTKVTGKGQQYFINKFLGRTEEHALAASEGEVA